MPLEEVDKLMHDSAAVQFFRNLAFTGIILTCS